ncbi:MAG TPA: hypothetical protein VN088_11720 [Nocardioides sp.]|nr:hypothetical protein [Nocardioides sp.]
MASFVPTDPETLDEQRRYTVDRLAEVRCLDCLAQVRVKKNSEHQTSIQWSAEAVAACPELCRRSPSGGRDGLRGCPRMMASIEAAVRDGALSIGAPDGY